MKHLSMLAILAVAAYAVLFGAGCIKVPALHDHEHKAETEHEGEEAKAKPGEKPPEEERESAVMGLSKAKQALASDDPARRADVLGRLGPSLYGPEKTEIRKLVLKVAREDKDPTVRAAAVGILAPLADELFQDILRASRDPDAGVRAAAAHALGNCIEESGRALVRMKQLLKDPAPSVQRVAQESIIGLTDTNRLIAGLGQFEHDQSARFAIQLAVSGDKVIEPLIRMLNTSQNPRQREAGATVLWTVCTGETRQERKYALWGQAEQFHQTPERRPANPKAVPILIKLLNSDPDARVRETAAQGLGHLGDYRAVPALIKALSDPAEPVRRRASSALVLLPDERAIPALARRVREDESPAVRANAAEALGWIKSEKAVEAIIPALEDPDAWVRRSAAMQLGRVGDRRALLPLVERTDKKKEPDPDVRWEAVKAVAAFEDISTKPALMACLNDPAAPVQHAAEMALRKLGYHRAVTELKTMPSQGS